MVSEISIVDFSSDHIINNLEMLIISLLISEIN